MDTVKEVEDSKDVSAKKRQSAVTSPNGNKLTDKKDED